MNYYRNFIVLCFQILIIVQPDKLEAGIWPLTLFQKPMQGTDNAHRTEQASPIATTIAHRFAGYIEYQPNGTIVLRSNSLQNDTNLQNLILFKTILKTINLAAPYAKIDVGSESMPSDMFSEKFNIKIYGEGVEHKFPPFLERFIQRIQTYFSVYRYTDTSSPVRQQITTPNTESLTETEGNFLTTNFSGDGDGDGGIYADSSETTTFEDPDTLGYGTTEDNNEFITIEEEDGFITVGED